jgi:hypothetical protein
MSYGDQGSFFASPCCYPVVSGRKKRIFGSGGCPRRFNYGSFGLFVAVGD